MSEQPPKKVTPEKSKPVESAADLAMEKLQDRYLNPDLSKELVSEINIQQNQSVELPPLTTAEDLVLELPQEKPAEIADKQKKNIDRSEPKEVDAENMLTKEALAEAGKIKEGLSPDFPLMESEAEEPKEKRNLRDNIIIKKLEKFASENTAFDIHPEITPYDLIQIIEKLEQEKEFYQTFNTVEISKLKNQLIEEEKTAEFLKAGDKHSEKIDAETKEKQSWIREKAEKAADFYKKRKTWEKILFSVGCVTAGAGAAMVGGTAGLVIGSAAFAGKFAQRTLGGLATFVTTEALLKSRYEKATGEERTKFAATRHTVEAAALGILIGSGEAAKAVKELSDVTGFTDIFKTAQNYWFPKAEEIKLNPEYSKVFESHPKNIGEMVAGQKDISVPNTEDVIPATGLSPEPALSAGSFVETAHKGDSVWKLAEHQLQSHYGEKFAHLNEAQKSYFIDAIKDKIAAHPDKFGLTDPDHIRAGQSIDFKQIFENKSEIDGVLKHTEGLSAKAIEHITHNNKIIGDWAHNHANEKLTSAKVDELLGGKTNVKVESLGSRYFINEPGSGRIMSIENGRITYIQASEIKPDIIINDWLDKTVKIDVKSGWFGNGNFLKNHTMGEVLNQDFLKWKDAPITAPFAQPDYGSPDWWVIRNKQAIQNQLEKLLRTIPVSERTQYKNMKIFEFLSLYIKKS